MQIREQVTLTVIRHARLEARAAGVDLYSRQGVALAVAVLEEWCRSRTTVEGPVVLDPEAQPGGET